MTLFRYYRFADRAAFLAASDAAGFARDAEGAPVAPEGSALDVVGTAFAPPPAPAVEGEDSPPPVALPGWHVNGAWRHAEPASFGPARIAWEPGVPLWAGVAPWQDEAPPPLAPGVVPTRITMAQARAVLLLTPGSAPGRTLFDDVDDALRAERDAGGVAGRVAWQFWEFANELERRSAMVARLAAGLGLSGAAVDELFRAAVRIAA